LAITLDEAIGAALDGYDGVLDYRSGSRSAPQVKEFVL
jgi:hypothetical protein